MKEIKINTAQERCIFLQGGLEFNVCRIKRLLEEDIYCNQETCPLKEGVVLRSADSEEKQEVQAEPQL